MFTKSKKENDFQNGLNQRDRYQNLKKKLRKFRTYRVITKTINIVKFKTKIMRAQHKLQNYLLKKLKI